ncbi:hypothetical protein [Leeuwenhoekiella nanhaiensis]|uniref:hypothetical protein n=1 Tax=Leeuwenhoekiella nanhaiensis TaxID=1655491 RepID=UPI00167105FC|nr:hypothetical protein [Leeuwenhoekiella nanhaiensis]
MKRILKENWLYIVAALITLFGLITGKYFFLFFVIPFGFNFFKSDKKDKDA